MAVETSGAARRTPTSAWPSVVDAAGSIPLVDRVGLDQLEAMVSRERLSTLIATSIAEAERSCAVMTALAAPSETRAPAPSEELAREAHNLSGVSGVLRLTRISQLTKEIEARARTASRVEPLLAELKELVPATAAELRRLGLMRD